MHQRSVTKCILHKNGILLFKLMEQVIQNKRGHLHKPVEKIFKLHHRTKKFKLIRVTKNNKKNRLNRWVADMINFRHKSLNEVTTNKNHN